MPITMALPNKRMALQRINRTPPLSSNSTKKTADSSRKTTVIDDEEFSATTTTTINTDLLLRISGSAHENQLGSVVRLDLDLRQQQLPPIQFLSNLQKTPNLKLLNLGHNVMTSIHGFEGLHHLVELNLAENKLCTLENLSSLCGLQRLNLSGNQLTRIPPEISHLVHLSVLRLSRNLLDVVNDLRYLQPLQQLCHLRIDDNPFSRFETTVPFALFCIPTLDSINGCDIMSNERKEAVIRFQQGLDNDKASFDMPAKVRFDEEDKENVFVPPSHHQNVIQHHSSNAKSSQNDTATPRLTQQSHRRGLSTISSRAGQLSQVNGGMMMIPMCLSDEMTSSSSSSSRALLDESMFSRDSINIGGTCDVINPGGRSAVAVKAITPTANPLQQLNNHTNPSSQRTYLSSSGSSAEHSIRGDKIGSGSVDTRAKSGSSAHTSTPLLGYTNINTNNSNHNHTNTNNHNSTFKDFFSPALSSPEIVDLRDRVDQLTTRLLASEQSNAQLSDTLGDTQQDLVNTKRQLLEATTMQEQLQSLVVGMQGEAEAAAEHSKREGTELHRASSLVEELSEQVKASDERALAEIQRLAASLQDCQDAADVLMQQRDEAMAEARRWRERSMLVSSELEAIRKEVLANSSAPSSPNNTNSNTSVPANSNGDTSLTSTNSLAKESAVRVMAMSQQCNGEGGLMCIEAGRQGHESAMKAVPPTHPNFCPAAVIDVNRRQGPGSEAGDASGEERSIARAEALEVALALMQEQLTAKSLALAVADERVAGMKKALELVSLALPPPPPPSHAYPTSSGQSSHPTTSLPPLLDDDRPNDDNHVNGIDMSPYMRIRKVEQQQQEEEDKIAALTRQKTQLGEDMLSLGRAHHHLNEDHAVLAKTHEALNAKHSELVREHGVLTDELRTLFVNRKAAEEALDNLTAEATRARLGLSTLEAERSLLEEQVTNAASKMAALSLAFEQKQAALSSLPEPLSDLALSCLRAERASLEASVASLRQDQRELEDRKGVMETSMVTFETRARAAQTAKDAAEAVMLEHQKALTQLQTSIAKAQGDEAEAVALAEGARRDRDACVALHDVEHRSLLQAREDAVRARGELVEVEGRARRAAEGARNEEHKMRQIKTLARDQVRSLQTDVEQLNRQIKDKQQHLATIEEQRQIAEADAETRRRELDLQCQQLRSDAEADGRKLLGLNVEVRKTQQELLDLHRLCRAAKEERVRLEECVQGDLRKIDQEKNEKEEQLQSLARDLQEMEDSLREWREEKHTLEDAVKTAQKDLEHCQRAERETRIATAARQKSADEEWKQMQHRTQVAVTALKELAIQTDKRRGDLDTCRTALRLADRQREEAQGLAVVEEAKIEGLKDIHAVVARDVERVQSELAACRSAMDTLSTRHVELKTDKVNEEKIRDALRNECRCLQEELVHLHQGEEALKSGNLEMTRQLHGARQELQQVRGLVERERRAGEETRALLHVAEAELQQRQEEARRSTDAAVAAETRLAKAMAEATAAERDLGVLQRRFRDMQVDSKRREGEYRRDELVAKASLECVQGELKDRSATLAEVQRRLAVVLEENNMLDRTKKSTEDECRSLTNELQARQEAIAEAASTVRQLETTRDALRAENVELHAATATATEQLRCVTQQLAKETAAVDSLRRDREMALVAVEEAEKQVSQKRGLLRQATEDCTTMQGKIRMYKGALGSDHIPRVVSVLDDKIEGGVNVKVLVQNTGPVAAVLMPKRSTSPVRNTIRSTSVAAPSSSSNSPSSVSSPTEPLSTASYRTLVPTPTSTTVTTDTAVVTATASTSIPVPNRLSVTLPTPAPAVPTSAPTVTLSVSAPTPPAPPAILNPEGKPIEAIATTSITTANTAKAFPLSKSVDSLSSSSHSHSLKGKSTPTSTNNNRVENDMGNPSLSKSLTLRASFVNISDANTNTDNAAISSSSFRSSAESVRDQVAKLRERSQQVLRSMQG